MYFGEKPRKGLSKFVAVLTALAIASASLLAVPAYAAESGAENQNPVIEFFGNVIDGAAQLFGLGDDGVETYATEDDLDGVTTAVDPDTTNQWNNHIAPGGTVSTQNIGRIWTDKSVFKSDYTFTGAIGDQTVNKGDSDFLVSLSALSSTSNLTSTVTRTDPLDIVLSIDRSSSMNDGIEQAGSYVEVNEGDVVESHGDTFWGFAYQETTGGTYYALVDGEYVRIIENTHRVNGTVGTSYQEHDSWTLNGQTVTPQDTQFYEYRSGGTISRMEALKTAANNFIDSAANLPNADQVRIGIVSFAGESESDWNASRIDQQLTSLSGNNAQGLKNTVNGINAPGSGAGTYPAGAFDNAQSMLKGSGQDTQKVVIFFTDGGPGGGSFGMQSWDIDNDVANSAINAAHSVKNGGTTVYSVGVLDDADPSVDVSNVSSNSPESLRINAYMHAVSSNYPDATGFTSNAIGNRAPESDYYKAATNADELNSIFDDIFHEIESNLPSGSPIEEVTQEGALNPGTLTFMDTLGSYMAVSGDTMTVVYGDRMFTSNNMTTADNVDTYHFEGTVSGNAVYGGADLADLTVTVTHGDDLADGDVVTVQVPASLIPMRHYSVDSDADTMSVTPAYPIRLFYGVSVKQGAVNAIKAGSGTAYDAILENQLSEDGTTIDFYSNAWANIPNGFTEATFTPSDGNKFYYYTQDTTLYIDQDCRIVATRWNSSNVNTFYYPDTYWASNGDGSANEVTEGVAILRVSQDFASVQTNNREELYIPAHTARHDRPSTLSVAKDPNTTGTASQVLVPGWNGNGVVSQALGNNGKLSIPAPGELEIKKNVDWGNASDETKRNQNSFEFTVDFNGTDTLAGEFAYDVYESGEQPVSNGTVTDGGTITLKAGQRAVIKGLPADTTFTVTENEANENGFTTTDTVNSDPDSVADDGIANGTIVAGSQQSVSFQNNYMADEPVQLSTETYLKVQKNLTGRDWRASDEFSFQITQINNGAPAVQMAEPTKVEITQQTNQQTASFGDITFSESGQYRFRVEELSDADQGITPIAGIDYSGAIYRVTVDVADAGQGNLEITSVLIEQMTNDDGGQGSGEVQGDTMAFENRYVLDQASETLQGTKIYTDTTGGNPIDAGKFSFQLEALGGYETGTVTGDAQPDDYTIAADSDAMPKPAGMTGTTLETGNVGDVFQFPTIYFDGNDVGKTFEYRITELAQQYQGTAEPGMSYDTSTSYVVKIVVTEEQDPESVDPKVVIVATPSLQPSEIEFNNTYAPSAAELVDDNAIHGTKTLEGRQMKEGETFYFQLSATNDNAKTVLADSETVTVTNQSPMDFAFGEMKFTKVGTYTFQVKEVADEQGTETTDADGMTFDTNICNVTVTVTDGNDSDDPADHGKLLASVSYSNDKHSSVTDHAQFTNVYKASMDYGANGAGGIKITKKMSNRPINTDDFLINLTGNGPDGQVVGAYEVPSAALGSNGTAQNFVSGLSNLKFDQDDAGKTFTFTVTDDQGSLPGVKYDKSEYRVDVFVVDDQDGTMHAETTVTQTKDKDGNSANNVVVDAFNSDTAQGQVPTFGFENSYEPTEASLEGDTALEVTKKVTGAASPDGVNYAFTLTAQDTTDGSIANIGGLTDGKLTVSTSGVINADATDNTDDDTQTVSFGKLTFSAPGTYTFTVQEDQPTADAGWTFDDADGDGATDEHTVTVEVSDLNESNEYDGALHIESVTPDTPTVITNSYKTNPVIVGGEDAEKQITVQKTVTGADSDAEFKFEIEPVIDDTHTVQWWRERVQGVDGFTPELTITGVTQAQAKTNSFAGIQFNAVGEYKFTVTEVGAADFNAGTDRKGWTYDEHTANVTVNVTDNGEGQLVAEVTYDNGNATQAAAFTNSYDAGSVQVDTGSATAKLTKVLEGRDWADGETFSFTVTADDPAYEDTLPANTTVEVSKPESGNTATFNFGPFTFDEEGTYTYTVKENQGTAGGMTYSTNEAKITITVTDNHEGGYNTGVSIANNTFTNIYKSELDYNDAEAGINIVKTLVGHEMTEFNFTVTPEDTDSAAKLGIDVGGETLTVKTGSPSADGLSSVGSVAMLDGKGVLMFNQGDEGKTYTYTVQEVKPSPVPAGYTYDETVYTVTITTDDDGQGGIKVYTNVKANDGSFDQTFTYDNDDTTDNETAYIPFENSYNATGELGGQGATSIVATKTLTNRPMVDREFHFTVVNAADQSKTVLADGYNDANGNIAFSAISYTTQQMQKDVENGLAQPGAGDNTYVYTYTVAEDTASLDKGVTAITPSLTITVTVTDNGDGTLGFVVGYPEDGTSLQFRNAYGEGQQGQATVNIHGNKGFKSNSAGANAPTVADINGKFTFTLTGVDEDDNPAPMPEGTVDGKKTATNYNGSVEFGDVVYTMENVFGDTGSQDAATNAEDGIATMSAKRTKTFTYTVTESGTVEGVDNDPAASKTFTVTVTDNGDGTLTKETSPNQDHGLALFGFTNEYNVDPKDSSPTGDGGLTVTKKMTGDRTTVNAGEFKFELVDAQGDVVAEGHNDANGNVQLGTVRFTADGEYTYTIHEAKGTNPGVDYDGTTYKAIATATDDGKGNLDVTWRLTDAQDAPAGQALFTNTYTAADTSVVLGGSKVLDGRALAEGEFNFQLTDAEGNVLGTVKNDAKGDFAFDAIAYGDPGTYEYTISEVKGDAGGVTYDDTTYAVKVVVTDDGQGKLQATTITYNGEAKLPVFHNTYTKPAEPPAPEEPKPEEPKPEVIPATGDAAAAAVMATAGIGAALAAAGYVTSKKRGE